ncbi:MAG: beta-galactosidase trimerization domain-containing protein, partial [Microbacteriaceae bacterium]
TRLSGIVDENNAGVPGGDPGRLAELLGVRVLPHVPLLPDETIALTDGDATIDSGRWAERVEATTAETVWAYADDAASRLVAGHPAVTRRDDPSGGSAWYVSAEIDDAAIARLLELAHPGLEALGSDGLDVVRRGDLVVAINHSPQDAVLALSGTDVLRGRVVSRPTVAAGDVLVLREGSE